MQSAQDRILSMIEERLTKFGYTVAKASDWANTGRLLFYAKNNPYNARGWVGYDFQSTYYKLTLTVDGQPVPSQAGRSDYFTFMQDYDKPTAFWTALQLRVGNRAARAA